MCRAIAAGSVDTCAALADGTVRCWGFNNDGQLGLPIPQDGGSIRSSKPTAVPSVTGAVEVAIGGYGPMYGFSCARTSAGTVSCWGSNVLRQLGHGDAGFDASPAVGAVESLSQASQIMAGAVHACATTADGGVTCWGSNIAGELGRPVVDGGEFLPPGPYEGLTGSAALTVERIGVRQPGREFDPGALRAPQSVTRRASVRPSTRSRLRDQGLLTERHWR